MMVLVAFAIGVTGFLGPQPVRFVAALLGVIYFGILASGWRGYAATLSENLTRKVPLQRRHTVDLAGTRATAKWLCVLSCLAVVLAILGEPR
jgi:hypothetical protein